MITRPQIVLAGVSTLVIFEELRTCKLNNLDASCFLQRFSFISPFLGEGDIFAAKVTIGGSLTINGFAQV